MSLYETVFITRQDLNPAEVDQLTDKFSKIVKEGHGKVVKSEYWGLRDLAYEINKNKKGHYILMYIDAPYAAVAEMERVIGFTETIIRSMTFKTEAIPEGNSKLFVAKNAKDGRNGSNYRERPRDTRADAPVADMGNKTEAVADSVASPAEHDEQQN